MFWLTALGCLVVASIVFGFQEIGAYQQRKVQRKVQQKQAEQQREIEEYWNVVRHNRRLENLQKAQDWVREENETHLSPNQPISLVTRAADSDFQ